MSIVRLVVVDPRPRKGEPDLRVYQVPEKSREKELLEELFDAAGLEHATIESPPRRRKEDKK